MTPEKIQQYTTTCNSQALQHESRRHPPARRLIASIAFGIVATAAACGTPFDPNNGRARSYSANTPFGQAMAKYGYTEINVSGNDLSGIKTQYGFGHCPPGMDCRGYAQSVYLNNGKVWTDGTGDYSCVVPPQYSQFDTDPHAVQIAILRVADSNQTTQAAAEASRLPTHLSTDAFGVTFDDKVWECSERGQ